MDPKAKSTMNQLKSKKLQLEKNKELFLQILHPIYQRSMVVKMARYIHILQSITLPVTW
jgi:hypothetical protein